MANWGCRCTLLPSLRQRARVLPSLLGPSPSGVCYLSHVCSSVGGPVGVAHSTPRSFLVVALSASAVGFANALLLCPERALRRFFAVDPVALSPLLPHVFADGFRHWCAFRFCGGASPLAFGPVGPLGSCGGSTYIALHRAWLVSAILQ